jgi:hypothetical protein
MKVVLLGAGGMGEIILKESLSPITIRPKLNPWRKPIRLKE